MRRDAVSILGAVLGVGLQVGWLLVSVLGLCADCAQYLPPVFNAVGL